MSKVGDVKKTWVPYADTDFPAVTKLRWSIMNPLQVHIPKTRFTLGEVIMLVLTLIMFGAGMAASTSEEGSGNLACLPFALAFATAAHNSVFTFIFGLPFERALFWHKYFAVWSVILGIYHGLLAEADLTGVVATAVAGMMLFAFFEPLRRQAFELFYRLHWVAFTIMSVMLLAHGAGGVFVGFFAWFLDMLIRYVYMAWYKHGHEATITALPADVIRITVPRKDFNYRAGQYCFICLPELSIFEWHPFSISSSPFNDDGLVSFHVRVLGDWTKALKQLAEKKSEVKILFEGPYGEPQIDFEGDKYKLFLLISGGIGITPMQSICNQIVHEKSMGRPVELCYFVWTCRDKAMVESVLPEKKGRGGEDGTKNTVEDLPVSFQPNLMHKTLSISQTVTKYDNYFTNQSKQPPGLSTSSLVESAATHKKKGDEESQGILSSREDDCVHTEFYLTQSKDENSLKGTPIREEARDHIKYGRPNMEKIFSTMFKVAQEKKLNRVAVLTCGPAKLVESVLAQVELHTTSSVTFDTHVETFAF